MRFTICIKRTIEPATRAILITILARFVGHYLSPFKYQLVFLLACPRILSSYVVPCPFADLLHEIIDRNRLLHSAAPLFSLAYFLQKSDISFLRLSFQALYFSQEEWHASCRSSQFLHGAGFLLRTASFIFSCDRMS